MKFVNGFTSWHETHYEVVSFIQEKLQIWADKTYGTSPSNIIEETQLNFGTGGMYDLAKEWTDEFEKLYKSEEWGIEKEFFEEIETFLNNKTNE